MPATWQERAARIVEEAYEYYSTDSERLNYTSQLFTEAHPYWYWNIALNARYVYHRTAYYLQVNINSDRLYIFSTT